MAEIVALNLDEILTAAGDILTYSWRPGLDPALVGAGDACRPFGGVAVR